MSKVAGGRRAALAASCAAPLLVLAAGAAAQTAESPLLPDEPFIPKFAQHDKPSPWPILPMVDFGTAPGEMPYRQSRVALPPGALGSVLESARPVKLGAGLSGAGSAKQVHAQAAQREANYLVMGAAAYETAGDYDDGSGDEVRFGYDRHTEQLVLGWMPAGRSLKAVLVNDMITDHKQPLAAPVTQDGVTLIEGWGADPVETHRMVGKVMFEDTVSFEALEKLKIEASYIGLDRIADNFSLRPSPVANRMRATPSADILAASAAADFRTAGLYNRIGVEARHLGYEGVRRGGPNVNNLDQVTGRQYPGVSIWEGRLFAETAHDFTADSRLVAGLAYDVVTADADKAGDAMRFGNFAGTPLDLYRAYHGNDTDADAVNHGLSARVRYAHDFLDDRAEAHVAAGRVFRPADPQERYFALASPNAPAPAGFPARQVGNPQLDPEYHNRLDIGGELHGDGWLEWGRKGPAGGEWLGSSAWRLAAAGYVDYVQDFISRDRAHGQDGVLRNDNASIWRNVDAVLAGIELDAQWNLTRNWSTRLNLAYSYGENLSDDRPLYGIDPFEANWIVDYHDLLGSIGTWHVGGKLRLVAAQNRADISPATGSGFDPAETDGFGVFDLYAGIQLHDRIGLRLGVDNVFDRTYAEHDPHSATDETNPGLVNAPGRFFYARAVANF